MRKAFVTGLAAVLVAGTAVAAQEVKIGFLSTLSGPSAAIAIDIRDGFNTFVQLNGGKLGGIPIEMIYGDDQQNPDTGKQLAEKLLKRDRVDFVTGIVFSNVMMAVAPSVFESADFPDQRQFRANRFCGGGLQPLVLRCLVAERRCARGGG